MTLSSSDQSLCFEHASYIHPERLRARQPDMPGKGQVLTGLFELPV